MIRGPEPGDGATVVAGPSVCLFCQDQLGATLHWGLNRDLFCVCSSVIEHGESGLCCSEKWWNCHVVLRFRFVL